MKHSTQDARKEWVDLEMAQSEIQNMVKKVPATHGHCLIAVKWTGTLEVIDGIANTKRGEGNWNPGGRN